MGKSGDLGLPDPDYSPGSGLQKCSKWDSGIKSPGVYSSPRFPFFHMVNILPPLLYSSFPSFIAISSNISVSVLISFSFFSSFSSSFSPSFCCLVSQSCLTFCDPMDCSLADSFVCGILQATILEWVAIPFSTPSF